MTIDEAIFKLKKIVDEGKSMKEIANESKIYYQTIRQINNDRANIQIKTLRKLIKYLERI